MTTTNLTVPGLKKFIRHTAKAAIKAVLSTRAQYAATKAHVDSYLDPAFAAFKPFTDEDTGERLVARKDLYLALDSQEAQVNEWFALCDQLHAQNGYKGLPAGNCPALMAEHEMIKAENVLLGLFEDFAGLGRAVWSLELRAETLTLLLSAPK